MAATTRDDGYIATGQRSAQDLITALPKAELHVHLEGTITLATAVRCANRNAVTLPWRTEDELAAAYHFADLPGFLTVLFQVARTLRQRQDFYDLTIDYLQHAVADNVVRAEIFFGPQTFLDVGVEISTMLDGVLAATADARAEWGIDSEILCTAERHRDESSALELLELLDPWREHILGIGLASAERGNPPSKFTRYFDAARNRGYRLTIHAGEDGPPEYIRDALDNCRPDRIDHGVTAADDPHLIERLRDEGIPLTMCPLSNRALHVVDSLADHPLKTLLDAGVVVTINSDDPPFFGGYLNDNYTAAAEALGLTGENVYTLAQNSIQASFLQTPDKAAHLALLDEKYCAAASIDIPRY